MTALRLLVLQGIVGRDPPCVDLPEVFTTAVEWAARERRAPDALGSLGPQSCLNGPPRRGQEDSA